MDVAGSKEKLLHRDEAKEATGFAAEQGEHGPESVGCARDGTRTEDDKRGLERVDEESVSRRRAASTDAGVKAEREPEPEACNLRLHVEDLHVAMLVRASELSARSPFFDKLLNGPFQEGACARGGLRDLHIAVPEPGAFTATLEYLRQGRLGQHPTCCQLVPGFLANAEYLLLGEEVRDYVSRMWTSPGAYCPGEVRLVLVMREGSTILDRVKWAGQVVEAHERSAGSSVGADEATLAARGYFAQLAEQHPGEWLRNLQMARTLVDTAVVMAVLPPPAHVVAAMLKKARCTRCRRKEWTLVSFAGENGLGGPCIRKHDGRYKSGYNPGWSCCGAVKKGSDGCGSAHNIVWT